MGRGEEEEHVPLVLGSVRGPLFFVSFFCCPRGQDEKTTAVVLCVGFVRVGAPLSYLLWCRLFHPEDTGCIPFAGVPSTASLGGDVLPLTSVMRGVSVSFLCCGVFGLWRLLAGTPLNWFVDEKPLLLGGDFPGAPSRKGALLSRLVFSFSCECTTSPTRSGFVVVTTALPECFFVYTNAPLRPFNPLCPRSITLSMMLMPASLPLSPSCCCCFSPVSFSA